MEAIENNHKIILACNKHRIVEQLFFDSASLLEEIKLPMSLDSIVAPGSIAHLGIFWLFIHEKTMQENTMLTLKYNERYLDYIFSGYLLKDTVLLCGHSELTSTEKALEEIMLINNEQTNQIRLTEKKVETMLGEVKKRKMNEAFLNDFTSLNNDLINNKRELMRKNQKIELLNKELIDQLLTEKRRLQQVIDGTDAGTWEWNVQTGETIFNEKWAQIIGYTLQELEPISIDTWIKHAHPEDLAASNQTLQNCFERRAEQYESACRMKHKSGEWIWVMDRGKVMSWTEEGKPEWMFGSHINITSIKRLEESLELERKKLSTIFNSTFQFIGFLDLEGMVLEANDTALDFAGLKPSDVIGKKFWDCHWWQINKETQDQLKEAIQKASKGEEVSYEVAVWDINKSPKTILFHLQPIKDQQGNVAFIIPEGTLIQDLIDYRTKLEDKNQELEGFAAMAAHDLKEPLRMITQFMQKLANKYEAQLDETAQKYIHFAADGANRMNSLINDLLAYAEIGGAKEEAFERVDMNDVFDETFLITAALIDEKMALVSKTTLPVVWAHKTAMRLLFQNLIGNGLKYQAGGNRPIIEIDFSETNNSYTFSFKDNGIGISEENHKKVFNLFSRLHANSEYAGTGMGLATCKKIVASHKGDIWLESIQGKGSTFYFTLPKINLNNS